MKVSLRTYIISSVAGLAAGCAIIAGFGYYGVSRVGNRIKEVSEVLGVRKDRWVEIRNLQTNLVINEQSFLMESRLEIRKSIAEKMDSQHKALDELMAAVAMNATGNSEDKPGTSEKAAIASFQKALYKWWEYDLLARREAEQGRRDAALQIAVNRGREVFQNALEIASGMVEALGKEMRESARAASTNVASSHLWIWVLILLTIAASVVNLRFMFKSLNYCTDMIARTITDNSTNVENTARQVADAASKLSQASAEQASALQQTAASAEELSAMVGRNQENAKQATYLSNSSQTSAHKGQQVVQEMAKAIYEINSSNQDVMNEVFESNRKISEITKVIAEIGQKTKIINDIVFQTKLLSFNASVEAARAGEHGRGFAIVAEEVGNLARMSGSAAKEIGDMLESSIHKVDTIVRETKTNVERLVLFGKEKVDAGTRIVGECSAVLDEIVTSITQVSLMSNDISSASDEQAFGVKEISTAVSQLDTVVHSNAISAEEAAQAADGLSGQAKALQSTVGELLSQLQGAASDADERDGLYDGAPRKASRADIRPKVKSEPVAKSGEQRAMKPAAQDKRSNVIEMNTAKESEESNPSALKLAAGGEAEIPLADDPRFKDI